MNVSKVLSLFSIPDSVSVDKYSITERYAKFIIGPFDKGVATSVGNSLRRFILSSVPGYAISAVKIEGLYHEFSAIPGAKEDFTDFVLNLKSVRLRLMSESEKKEVFIHLKGPGLFKAGDLSNFDSDIKVSNPDLLLLTLNEDADLRVKLIISYGKRYVLADDMYSQIEEIGLVPIDGIFSPVEKVVFDVEEFMKDNKLLERCVLEVYTDGTISPVDAYLQAVEVFRHSIRNLSNLSYEETGVLSEKKDGSEIRELIRKLSASIDELGFSAKVSNTLKESGIHRVYDLVNRHEEELKFKNFGKKSFEEVKEKLESWGLSIGMSLPAEIRKILGEE